MQKIESVDRLFTDLNPIITGLGYTIVEFKKQQVKGTLHVSIVIYKHTGISLDDCEEVHNTVLPRIELLEDLRDIHLEVSSPGINRKFKSADEFPIFVHNNVKILEEGASDWVRGQIESADEESVTIKCEKSTCTMNYEQIKKAKLDN
jgi:ribosome maturation factor RimP